MTKFFQWRSAAYVALLVAAGLSAGCEGGPEADTAAEEGEDTAEQAVAPADAAADEASRADNAHHWRGKHRDRGPAMLLGAALRDLDLTDAQRRAIEEAKIDLRADEPGKPEVFTRLSAAVRSGSIDEKAFEADIAAAAERMEAGRGKSVKALETLHATLTPEQRKQLVAGVLEKMDERAEKWASKGHKDRGPRADRAHTHLDFMLKGVDVSDAKRAEIEAALAKAGLDQPAEPAAGKASKAEMLEKKRAAVEAFGADTFDAAAVMPAKDRGPEAHLSRMVKALAVVVPLLDEGQRAALADRIERGPMLDGRGHGKKGHEGRRGAPVR